MSWLNVIRDRVSKIPGVTTEFLQPEDLSNHAPQLRMRWDGNSLGITGTEVVNTLANGTPRIFLASGSGVRPDAMSSSVTIMPYMMMPGDHQVAADALCRVLTNPPKFENPVTPSGQPSRIEGLWDVRIHYNVGAAQHRFIIEQSANTIHGVHEGETIQGVLSGSAHADQVSLRSVHPTQGTSIEYTFAGTAAGDEMRGTVALGEYGSAPWTAVRKHW
jgi:hypothetical protein